MFHLLQILCVNESTEGLYEILECLFNLDFFLESSENQTLHILATGMLCCARVRRLIPKNLDILKTKTNQA